MVRTSIASSRAKRIPHNLFAWGREASQLRLATFLKEAKAAKAHRENLLKSSELNSTLNYIEQSLKTTEDLLAKQEAKLYNSLKKADKLAVTRSAKRDEKIELEYRLREIQALINRHESCRSEISVLRQLVDKLDLQESSSSSVEVDVSPHEATQVKMNKERIASGSSAINDEEPKEEKCEVVPSVKSKHEAFEAFETLEERIVLLMQNTQDLEQSFDAVQMNLQKARTVFNTKASATQSTIEALENAIVEEAALSQRWQELIKTKASKPQDAGLVKQLESAILEAFHSCGHLKEAPLSKMKMLEEIERKTITCVNAIDQSRERSPALTRILYLVRKKREALIKDFNK